ncbi:IclR family transcriptional regulator [Pseudophaeobacter sp.]|uniref:IclR family transcriptional regulator n=1 Tax=Pseudophaeobacter sp. TaxID=1971739 RepID=UPI003299D7A9
MQEITDLDAKASPLTDNRKGVQSVDRAFDLLNAFERSERPLGVKDISLATGMTPSQVHHYLVSLTRTGAIRQRPEGTYELGVFTLQLGLSALRRLEPVERAVQAARAFRDASGEATFIALWGSHGPTIIRYFEAFQPVTVEIRAGLTMPLLGSATGHVFLTWLREEATADFISQETQEEAKSTRELTREAGLGHVHGALLPRISALSAPVFDRDGRLAFSMTALGWIEAFDDRLDGSLAASLRKAAQSLSTSLGHSN